MNAGWRRVSLSMNAGWNVLSGLHAPLFPRRFFEIHHKIIAFRRQKTTRHWLFFAGGKTI
ncbi:hypothetical protein LTSEWAN_4682 [Salmonella enterica subsp. enterica serovar Wandsworth str. A4-580]|uniref:Uncharacterized protein n=1 Tax=Salmonella enterica subsp. enterica serovar Wandsworth str. A4-580 TaxID=913086 RepID=G5SGK6_SALET|nr:hypothetical protein LTSEWAN_4682 [Salmonella enterica subsp. enterica serovar Wandsworth str. A4-580]